MERTAEATRAALAAAPSLLRAARAARARGQPLIEIAQELAKGAAGRVATAQAYQEYEHAVFDLRAAVIRALVDDEGLTLSQLATAMRVSRQTVARLYAAGGGSAQE